MVRGSVLAALLLAGADVAAAPEAYRALRSARPDGRSVAVADLTLTRDVFTIHFETGRFHLLAPVEGRTLGAVFLGKGSFELAPASERERRYLAFRRRIPELETFGDTFERMVLFFKDDTLEEITQKGQVEAGTPDPRAISAYESQLKHQRKDWKLNVQLRLYRAMLQHGAPFYAFVNGASLPAAVLAVDPTGILGGEETLLFVDDLEQGGALYSSHRRGEIPAGGQDPCPRVERKLDALAYAIDTRIRKNTSIDAVATIRFKSLVPDLRVVPLEILPDLRIREASLLQAGSQSALPVEFIQEDKDADAEAALILPEPLAGGQEVTVRVAYAGDEVVEDAGHGSYTVWARSSWYPNLGVDDRATYDLTFHVPPKNRVVAVGRPVSSSDEPGGTVSVWKADLPVPVAGFNYGAYTLLEQTEKTTGVRIGVYTNPQSDGDPEALANDALSDAGNSIQVYAALFGAPSYGHLSITQQTSWFFGQSWPTLIFLPSGGAYSSTRRSEIGLGDLTPFIDKVVVHEVAHQWWGNRVTARTYHDQWLEEGMAEFATALEILATHGNAAYDAFWEKARRYVVEKSTGSAVRNFEAGPMTLGMRLDSMRSPSAYQATVYSKGAYVLHMLRMLMRDEKSPTPDERFMKMLRDFFAEHDGKDASTEDFKAAVEKHMVPELNATRNGKIDWFFEQWVYGTEIPHLRSSVEIEKVEGGKWHIHGTLAQEGVSASFLTMVPLYLEFDKGKFKALGRTAFRGSMTQPVDVTLDLEERPKRLRLNLQHEVLSLDEP